MWVPLAMIIESYFIRTKTFLKLLESKVFLVVIEDIVLGILLLSYFLHQLKKYLNPPLHSHAYSAFTTIKLTWFKLKRDWVKSSNWTFLGHFNAFHNHFSVPVHVIENFFSWVRTISEKTLLTCTFSNPPTSQLIFQLLELLSW